MESDSHGDQEKLPITYKLGPNGVVREGAEDRGDDALEGQYGQKGPKN